jgi:arylsulfatase A-like enzyme
MKHPNVLIFMTDQQRADSVTDPKCLTPNLDKFLNQSITFTNTFCPSPHCCPSRASFMSGLYPSQHGVWHNVNVANAISRGLNDGVRLWSEDFAEAGYDMTYSGKWHVSAVENPDDRGWKVYPDINNNYINTPEKAWEKYRLQGYKENKLRAPGTIIRNGWAEYSHYGEVDNPFNDQGVVDAALEIIHNRDKSDKPWCQFIGTLGPHDPYKVPSRFLDMYDINDIELPLSYADKLENRPNLYKRTRDVFDQLSDDEHREAIRHYMAFCSYEDYLFGQVLDALEQNGQLDNTIIIYTSDHGDYRAEHGLWCKGLPCFQGAYKVPLVISWNKGIENPGRTVDEYIAFTDFAPTFLDAAGITVENEFAGKSLVPFFRNEKVTDWRDAVYTQSNGNEQYGIQRSVMTDKWKYVYNGFDYDELYDLEKDPDEMINVINDPKNKEVIKTMCKRMWELGYKNKDNCINPYIMIGFAPYGPGIAFE